MTPIQDFLRETPPWLAFPGMQPMQLGATQGAQEVWFDSIWRPFWRQLDAGHRQLYHQHWQTTQEWREAIDFFCDGLPPELVAAHATQTEEYLQMDDERARLQMEGPASPLKRLLAWWRGK